MEREPAQTLSVAGKIRSIQDAMGVLERYPRKTPAAFDLVGVGKPGNLTPQEVVRTRKISSRITNNEVTYFVEIASTAPWDVPSGDLAAADPDADSSNHSLFSSMSDLYWHFAKDAHKGVSFEKISKVLHLKMPDLFPILDSHIARAYAPAAKALRKEYPDLGWRRRTWIAVRKDLLEARASGALDQLRHKIRSYRSDDAGMQEHVRRLDGLTDLRLLDILVW